MKYVPQFNGKLIYQEQPSNFVFNNNNPLSAVTEIIAADNCVDVNSSTNVGADGTFSIPMGQGPYTLKIKRDIPNSLDINNVINSQDAVLITKIRNDNLANPTISQLIAADVNNDRRVTSGDRTLVRRRTVGLINEFPNNPDWKFYISNTVFPGANKDNVPVIPGCIPLTSSIVDGCVKIDDQVFSSVLIGDVDASWVGDAAGANLRQESVAEVEINLEKSVKVNGKVFVPVNIKGTNQSVYAFDLDLVFDNSNINTIAAAGTNDPIYNIIKGNRLLAAVDKEAGFSNLNPIDLEITTNKDNLSIEDFGNSVAYINGKAARVSITGNTTNVNPENKLSTLNLFPNPSENGIFTLAAGVDGEISVTALNYLGIEIYNKTFINNAYKNEIDMSAAAAGYYIVKIQTAAGVKTIPVEIK